MTIPFVHGDPQSTRQAEAQDVGEDPGSFARLRRFAWVGCIVFAVLFVLLALTGYIEKWLWMRQVDYVAIFWTVLSVQCALGLLAFVIVFGFLWFNLHEAVRGAVSSTTAARLKSGLASVDDSGALEAAELFPLLLKGAFALVSACIAVLFAIAMFTTLRVS
jgi:uncharacterized membrane protein (UPF0182 family)